MRRNKIGFSGASKSGGSTASRAARYLKVTNAEADFAQAISGVGVLLDCATRVEKKRLIRKRKAVNEIVVLGIQKKAYLRVRCANTSYPEQGQLYGD